MTLSVHSRFEVFKRDAFTCGYCGKTPSDGIKLEVDHITPRAKGGGDEMTNLVTSCWDCNHGKRDKSLDDKAPSLTVAMQNTRERALQLDEYRRWQGELDGVTDALVHRIWDEWIRAFYGSKSVDGTTTTWTCEGIGVPSKQALMRYVDEGAEVEIVLKAIESTRRRYMADKPDLGDLRDGDVQRYFFGTLKRISEEETPIPTGSRDCDGACGYLEGKEAGRWRENERIKELLLNHEGHGFATYADVVAALWPEAD